MQYKLSLGEKLFNIFNWTVLGIVGILALYPFMYTLSMSLSSTAEARRAGMHFLPRVVCLTEVGSKNDKIDIKAATKEQHHFTMPFPGTHGVRWHFHPDALSLTSYIMVFRNPDILTGYGNTLFRTIFGTFLTVLATCICAYPLSRRYLPYRKQFIFFLLFTMLFSGGLIPYFLLIKSLGLYNSRWVYIIPGLIAAFNVLIVKNFFQSIPDSFAESAQMDGASEWTILTKIYMPLSLPVLATITLWTAVGHWNGWFDAMIFISDNSKQVLQTFLQRVVIEGNLELIQKGVVNPNVLQFTPETIKAATVIVTILPILIFYPFVQKYFVKGIMLGGIKE